MTPHAQKALLVTGLLLVLIGVAGGTVTAVVVGTAPGLLGQPTASSPASATVPGTPFAFTSNGERVYYTGVGHAGPIQVEWNPPGRFGGMMRGQRGMGPAGIGCVACHGEDGRGGRVVMMFSVRSADIRYESLTRPHADDETTSTVLGWTDADIARAIREGVEPDGEPLGSVMPRWSMDDTDMTDLIDYLKEL